MRWLGLFGIGLLIALVCYLVAWSVAWLATRSMAVYKDVKRKEPVFKCIGCQEVGGERMPCSYDLLINRTDKPQCNCCASCREDCDLLVTEALRGDEISAGLLIEGGYVYLIDDELRVSHAKLEEVRNERV